MTTDRVCPFCDGGGLRSDGERACSECGGSGSWADAAMNILRDAVPTLTARDNPYRESAAVLDLLSLIPPQRKAVGT